MVESSSRKRGTLKGGCRRKGGKEREGGGENEQADGKAHTCRDEQADGAESGTRAWHVCAFSEGPQIVCFCAHLSI